MEEETIDLQQLSRKDKFHLLRVPRGFDISQLNGIEYDPQQIMEVEVKQDASGLINVYELGTFAGQSMDLNLLVKSEDRIQIGPALSNNLSITKTVKADSTELHSAVKSYQAAPSGSVCLPQGLRERFSPFGGSHSVPPTRKHSSKKTKKRQRSKDVGESPIKAKRQKPNHHETNSDNEYDSQVFGHRSVGNHGDAGNGDITISTPIIEKVKKQKKSKKRKSNHSDDDDGNGDVCNEGGSQINGFADAVSEENLAGSTKSKRDKKKSRNSGGESGFVRNCGDFIPLNDNNNNNGISEEDVKPHKKKKKKNLMGDTDRIDGQVSDDSPVKEKRHKEKKKKKDKD